MKRIYLKKLTLKNFKGIKSFEVNFIGNETEIYGDNGTGKTTLFDAFTWLLFGKDHNDKTTFEIKTLDSNNLAIPQLNHEVEALLDIDGNEVKLRRLYKERWQKQRGSSEAVMVGHTTDYFHNDVPVTLSEFGEKTKAIIEEPVFKLLTNPFYFNNLAWATRRTILTKIANIESDAELAQGNEQFLQLLIELSGKSFDEFKRLLNAKKKVVKDELDQIPTRIDEVHNSIPETEDFEALEVMVITKEQRVKDLHSQIVDNSKVDEESANKKQEKRSELLVAMNKQQDLKEKAQQEVFKSTNLRNGRLNEKKQEIQKTEFDINTIEMTIENDTVFKRQVETKIAELRLKFDEVQAQTLSFDDSQFNCPTCQRELEFSTINFKKEEMAKNFNIKKAKDLDKINSDGKMKKDDIAVLDYETDLRHKKLEELKAVLLLLSDELVLIENEAILTIDDLLANEEYVNSTEDVKRINQELMAISTETVSKDIDLIQSLEKEREETLIEINDLKTRIYKKGQIESGNARIKELQEKAKLLAQELATLESKEFLVEQFNSMKNDKIESAVNKLFPTVRFKLFNYQINGGISECCDTLINGVPFDNANNAAKIQAGIETINVLAEHHGFTAPIFVDNAESVVKLPFTSSQLIKLVVSENYKVLTVKN